MILVNHALPPSTIDLRLFVFFTYINRAFTTSTFAGMTG
jgi:hypothetical protein